MSRALALLAALLALVVAGCGGSSSAGGDRPPDRGPLLRIGTKNFTEQYILGELYAQALRARGFRVRVKSDVGSTEIIHQALTGGSLDLYPEYVGVLLSEVAGVRERPRDPQAAYLAAKRYEERRGFTLLAMTPFSDQNALAVSRTTARRTGVRSIADLGRLGRRVRIAAPPEFATRFEGVVGLRSVYGLKGIRAEAVPIGEQYGRLDARRVQAAAVFTTDGQLADEDYVQLADPRGLFASQRATPIVSRRALRTHGARLPATIDAVSAKLTTKAMRGMNAAVVLRGAKPAAVATRFLRANGLLPRA